MRRFTLAALLAALGFLTPSIASTNDNPCTYGLPGHWSCALRLFPKMHQHGPLYNYGPYYGYPPFEPYGYWNSNLQYTGPNPIPAGQGQGSYGWIHGPNQGTFGGGFPHPLRGRGQSGGCSTCGAAAEQVVTSGKATDRFNGVGAPAASQAYYADSHNIITVGHTGR